MHFGETPFTSALWEHMLYFNIFDTPLHFCTISRESAESAIVKYSSQKIIMNDLFSYWRGLGVWMISGLNSREKMAHRTNSIQWRVTLPSAKLSLIKRLGYLSFFFLMSNLNVPSSSQSFPPKT